jgi:hypothetical protein
MRRAVPLPLALLLGAATAPAQITAPGTVQSRIRMQIVQSGPIPVCMINATIDPNGAMFDTLGPATALYRGDPAVGTVALALPRIALGTLTTTGNTTVAAYTYISQGEASLVFTDAKSGGVTFIGGGNTLNDPDLTPSFSGYTATWHAKSMQLEIHAVFDLDGCKLPIVGSFQF